LSHPKTINIKQYLSTDNFSVNNWHVVTKSSQTTQLYITKVNYKHFSCHHHIKKHFRSSDEWGMSSKMKKIGKSDT
jgi:hypothetical protein